MPSLSHSAGKWEQLGQALKRLEVFKRELRHADPAKQAQLLEVWKEEIIDDCIVALRATDDVDLIGSLDCKIGSVLDMAAIDNSARARLRMDA